MNKSLNYIFSKIESEHSDYIKTAQSHPDSYIDQFVIMQECYEQLPNLIPNSLVSSVKEKFYEELNGKQTLADETIRQLIVAMYLSQ